ncbi:hypothetical protein [Erythrobacter sp. F6033]|uniref:beta strand repeat-containing protein n=1 Tax=Erythrobacter sp. F6033 TaxID=2926401 RepID=UPI001FF65E9A|nr:hypothetical protein [Erythrobacter sp. F6033]MCK0127895.1 hypothetical protein [Erythrobacter sp. F6033]
MMKNAKLSAAEFTAMSARAAVKRKRWLGSGSVLAAAIAMTATLAEPVAAQSGPIVNSRANLDPSLVSGGPGGIRPLRMRAPRETAPPPPVKPRPLPTPIANERIVMERGITLDRPVAPQPVSPPAPAPQPVTKQPTVNSVGIRSVTPASSTPATLPGDTNTPGINVLATANYFGSDVDFTPGVAEDVVELFSSQAIINWETFAAGSAGNTVDFLAAGGNLRFTSDQSDFTVLNRIFTPGIDSAVRIDGSVTSDVLSGVVSGGNVWFYSPGGIVVGPTGSFDVGSLVLTSSEISAITSTISFGGVAEPDTAVVIESGATIDAVDDVILVAPRIEQGGTVRAGGNIAYVGAEQAEISVAGGLFSISVNVGTDDANGIVHTGSTGGATVADNPNRGISIAAQGQDAAVNLLLGGSIGYDDASTAFASNGTIFLSAGDGTQANSGDITFGAGNINSSVNIDATGEIAFAVDGQGNDLTFGSATQQVQVFADADQSVAISATSGANINVNGNLTVGAGEGGTGGTINITVDDAGRNDDSSISGLLVSGNLDLNANALGTDDTAPTGVGGDAVGGTININASLGGEIIAGGVWQMRANAQAGFGGFQSGTATGGLVNIAITGENTRVGSNGFMGVSTQADAALDPFGSSVGGALPVIGSDSTGGAVNISVTDGVFSAPSLTVFSSATATAGSADADPDTQDAVAGDITIANSGTGTLDLGQIFVQANGTGADGATGGFFEPGARGGAGTGGVVSITSSTDLTSLTAVSIAARGNGGNGGDGGFSGTGGVGGVGQGGDITLSVSGTGALLDNLSTLFLDTSGQGGNGGVGGTEASLTDSGDGGAGGNGIGGTASFGIGGTGATFDFDTDLFNLSAGGNGGNGGAGAANFSGLIAGDGGAGGDGTGGDAILRADSGSTLTLSSASVGANLSVSGNGGAGGSGGFIDMGLGGFAGDGGAGGVGTGGSPQLVAAGGTITGTNVDMSAIGAGGAGGIGGDDGLTQLGLDGAGGDAFGGTPTITTIDGSPGVITFGNLNINASAFGGSGNITGTGSAGQIAITDGSADPAGLITLGSLGVSSLGTTGTTTGLLTISSDSGPITVTGAVNANVQGSIDFDFDADGQIVVGGTTTLTASGNIGFAHTNNTGDLNTIDGTGAIVANAGLAFVGGDGTNIVSGAAVTVDAGTIAYDDITAGSVASLTSRTGSITGTSTGTVTGSSVVDAIDMLSAQDITFGNLVSLNGNIDIDAIGNITGVDANSAQFINIDSTGAPAGVIDVDTVTSGSLVTINGGSVDIETLNAGFIANILTTVGDLDIATLNSASSVNLDAAGSIILGTATTSSFISNSVAATTIGSLTTTGGTADVVIDAGTTAAYTTIDVDRQIRIDAASIVGGDLIVDANVVLQADTIDIGNVTIEDIGNIDIDAFTGTLSTGDLTGNIIQLDTPGDLSIGAVNAASTINIGAGNDAVVGDVDTGGLTWNVTGNLDAGNITGNTTVATSRIIVGGDADITSMTVDNLLNVNVTGALTGGAFRGLGPISIVTLDAGSIDIASVESTNQSVTLTARNGDAVVGNAVSGGQTSITADNITLDNGDVGGTLRLNATAGDISGTGVIDVAGAIDLDATGDIGFGSLSAGTSFAADANGNIAFNSASAASTLTFNAGGDIGFTSLSGDNTVTLDATGAINGGAVTTDQVTASSTFTAGTSVTLGDVITRIFTVTAGTDITLGAVDALGRDIRGIAINLDAGGNVDFTSLTSGRGIDIDSATISGGNIVTDNGIDIQAEAISIGDVTVVDTGPVNLVTSISDLTVGNISNTNFGIALDSAGALTAGDLTLSGTSNSSDIDIIAAGNTIIGDATSGNQLDINVTGNLTAGNLVSNVVSPGTTIDVTGDASIASFDALLGPATLTIGGVLTGGTFATDGGLSLNAASVDVAGAISRGQAVNVTATLGDATIGNAQAATDLTVDANGTPTIGTYSVGDDLTLTGSSVDLGAGVIAGNLLLQALGGDVTLTLDGNESIVVGGQATLNANGNIVVTHTNNATGAISLDVTGNINTSAGGDIDAQSGSILSGFEVFLLANGSINVDDVRGIPGIVIEAGGSVTVNNATATGPQFSSNISGITIDAGLNSAAGIPLYDPIANALITGSLNSYSNIVVRAGGVARFAAGSSTNADNRVFVQTGDDIIVDAGATITSANNPSTAPNPLDPFNGVGAIDLQAGGLTNLLSIPSTPIASLVVNGTLNANNAAIIGSANAIDGLDGTFMASSIALDINDAPVAMGFVSDDNGLLSMGCFQGNICIGNIMADNVIEIGQASNNDVIELIIQQGTVNANDILITTRNDIVMGTNGIATTLNAANTFTARSLTGNVDLLDAAITSGQIVIDAAGSLVGSGTLTSVNDIGISVGQDLSAAAIVTDGQLTRAEDVGGALEALYNVPGFFNVDLLSIGTGNINVSTGDGLRIGTAIVPGTNIVLSAGTIAQLDFTDSAVGVFVDGGSVVLGDITVTGDVSADSNSTIDFTTINADNDISFFAGTDAIGGDLTAGATAQIDAQFISLNTVDAANITLNSASDIFFDLLTSPNAIGLTATNGTIGANMGPGDIDSGGSVSLEAQIIDVGNIDAAGNVDLTATAGSVTVGDVSNTALGSGISLTAGGANGDINAGTLTANSGDILISAARNIALISAATSAATPTAGTIALLSGGDVSATGSLSAGEDLAIRSLGNASLASIAAGDDVIIDADGSVALDSATSSGTGVDLFAIVFDTTNAGQANSILFGAETSSGSNIGISGGTDVTAAGTLNANGAISVTATGTPSIGNAISGGDTSVSGASVTFNNGTVGGDLSLIATAGDIDGSGTVSVAGGIALQATGGIGFGTLVAQNGDFTAVAGDDIVFDAVDSSQLVDLQAGGLIQGDRIDAATSVTLSADSSIFIDHAEAGTDFTATAGGNFTTGLNSIITGGDVVIAGDIVDLGNSTAGGLIDVQGTQIDFVNLIAGSTISLLTDFNTPTGVTGSGNLNITGATISAGAGGSSLDALGSISISGATSVLGSLTMDADGDIAFATALVQGGDFAATAGGRIDFTSAESIDMIDFLAGQEITATGDITGSNGVVLESSDASVSGVNISSGGDVTIRASSTVDFNDIAVDLSEVDIVAGSNVTLNDITASSAITISSGGGLTFNDFEAGFGVILSSQNATIGQSIDAGAGVIASAGGFLVDDIDAVSEISITSSDVIVSNSLNSDQLVTLRSTGAADITVGTLNAGTNVTIETGGEVDVTSLAGAQSGSGDINVQGDGGIAISTLSGIAATLEATNGAINVGDAIMSGLLSADGQSVFIRSTDDLAVAANATDGNVDIAVDGNLATEGISANGDVILASGGSSTINVAATAVGTASGPPPGSQGVQQITTVNGGDITITAGTDILINSVVSAAGNLAMTAGGLIDLQATASGATMQTESADINIGTSGALGRSDLTTSILIGTVGDIQLGGPAGTSTGFELDNDEFSRVHSGGDITITATGLTTGEGNINVGDLNVLAGQGTGTPNDGNIANFGGLFLEATNDVNILGNLLMTGLSPDGLLAIDAANLITIDAENATIRLEDTNGAVTGLIGMTADSIIAASGANQANLAGLTFAEIEDLLGQAATSPRPDGYILGSNITFNVDGNILIENSGSGTDFPDRRGIVADTLTINSSNADVGIVINGVIDGSTGLDAVALLTAPTDFDPASTVNGCLLGDPTSCVVTTTPPTTNDPGPDDGPIRDLIDDQVEEDSPLTDTVSTILVELREDPEQQEDPLLDEPVTGAGNEDFWFAEDEEEEGEEENEEELEPAE